MPDTLAAPERSRAVSPARPPRAPSRLVAAQITHATRGFARNPVAAVVTLAFPLGFLLLLGLAVRDASPDPATGVSPIQLAAPTAAVFAAVMATYVMLPLQLAQARERGVLKRLHGTPLPMWAYVAGQVVSALAIAAVGVTVMFVVGMVAFGLELPLRALPALVVSFLVGVGGAAALGVAVASLVRGAETVMTVTMGSFLLLAFASGLFGVGAELPRVLDVTTWWFPLRHLAAAFEAVFVAPAGSAFVWSHLGVLAAWGAVGGAVATWGFQRAPRQPSHGHPSRRRSTSVMEERRAGTVDGSSSLPALAARVLRHANRSVWRQPASAFFSVAFPILFTVVVPYALGDPVIDGVPLPRLVTPAMAVFAVVVTAFVNIPESIAIARDRGVLKRLRGTPLPASAYLLGRLGSVTWVAAIAIVGVFVAGRVIHGVTVPAGHVAPLVLAFTVGTAAFAALGLAIVAMVPNASSVPAVGLAIFLPLGFISDMLAFGMQMPTALSTIGWVFPLKHLMHAVDAALTSGAVSVGHLAVVAVWGALGALVAVMRFRWAPR